ncbi:MAG TPA: hypothetical protein VKR32_12210 [Puia sp.]|nr:hypothetical protein [Puia sp.]
MDVHHHPEVEKKGFKEYFLEFLMIFLAVTMGFFAESLRERIADHENGKRNIESIIKSVSIDTSNIKQFIELNLDQIKGIDSFIEIKNEDIDVDSVKWKYYYYTLNFLNEDYYWQPKNAGIEQLKSSGGLNLIKDQSIVDSILGYDIFNNQIGLQQSDCHYLLAQIWEIEFKLLDFSIIKNPSIGWLSHSAYNSESKSIQLPAINKDPVLLKQFFGYVTATSLSNSVYVLDLENQLERGRHLIAFLKKEYNIP